MSGTIIPPREPKLALHPVAGHIDVALKRLPLSCTVLFYLTKLVFGFGEGNSLAYISHTYTQLPYVLSTSDRLTYFLIFSTTSMVFSPIGEEIFYRGFVHECFAPRVGAQKAALVDSAAFTFVHLAHFGLVYWAGG
jgi:membrane protease YdiL (CAAX protease family)